MTTTTWREFRFQNGKKVLVWKIRQLGDTYETMHGQLDGQMQTFSDRPGDKGVPDTKAYVNANDNCTFNLNREIRKKTEKGYVELIDGKCVSEQVNELDFKQFLPKNFCLCKPQTSIEPAALEKMHKAKNATYTRKRDGMQHLAVKHPHGWEMYSRRMDLATERFPLHIAELDSLDYQEGTVLVGEILCERADGTDDFKSVSRICRSDPEDARKLVADGEVPEPLFVVFDIIRHNGKDLKDTCYGDRCKLRSKISDTGLVQNVKLMTNVTPSNWSKMAKDNAWEGFVVVDSSSVPGDKFYSFHGDAKRPKGHHKLKPVYEDDVVIYATVKGSGKRLDGIGAVFVKQLHPETKQWIGCGKVGSGFTDDDLVELEKLCYKHKIPCLEKDKEAEKLDLTSEQGIVIQIEYGERQPGTQKFRFPVFIRVRDDKGITECVAQALAADADDDE